MQENYAVSQEDLRRKRNGPDRDDEGGSNEEMKELLQSLHVKGAGPNLFRNVQVGVD